MKGYGLFSLFTFFGVSMFEGILLLVIFTVILITAICLKAYYEVAQSENEKKSLPSGENADPPSLVGLNSDNHAYNQKVELKNCSKCRSVVMNKDRFCENCGFKL